jgi:hypothetical protein
MANHNPKTMTNKLQGIEGGVDKVLVSNVTMMFRGQNVGAKTLAPMAADFLGDYTNVELARTALAAAIAAREANEAAAEQFAKDVQAGALATFGENSQEYKAFGFAPRKKPIELTHEQKETKYKKLLATRAARHTMGKRQKEAVKGVVAPPAAPEAPASGTAAPQAP